MTIEEMIKEVQDNAYKYYNMVDLKISRTTYEKILQLLKGANNG